MEKRSCNVFLGGQICAGCIEKPTTLLYYINDRPTKALCIPVSAMKQKCLSWNYAYYDLQQ